MLRRSLTFVTLSAVLWASSASAGDFVPSISLQGGVTYFRSPGADSDDYFVAATPTLTYFEEGKRSLFAATYSFTGSLNTFLPNGVSNDLNLSYLYDLTPRTRLIAGVDVLQSLVGNYLLVRRSADTAFGALPNLNASLLSVTANQGIGYEIAPSVGLNESFRYLHIRSLDPDQDFENQIATATLSIDKSSAFDALGAELGVQASRSNLPPLPPQVIYTASLGPTWDHDITPTLSSSLGAFAQVAFSPDPRTKPVFGPAGRASIAYRSSGSGIALEGTAGIEPNVLVGTLLNSQQVTLRGFTPISERKGIVLGVGMGLLHAKTVDLADTAQYDNEFSSVLHDADVTWSATEFLNVFFRYQFVGQTSGVGAGSAPALVRHAIVFGVDIFGARPVDKKRLPPQKLGQRVDGTDSMKLGPSAGRPGGGAGGR